MSDLSSDAIKTIADLARTGEPQIIEHGNFPFAVIPAGAKLESLERHIFNDHAEKPERIKANVTVLDPQSFIEYYNRFADDGSRIFAYEPDINVLCVLDYHHINHDASSPTGEGARARWGQHRLMLTLRESEQWKVWAEKNGKTFTQMQFAEFLEQHAIDIAQPAPAGMMEIARDLQTTSEVDFGSSSRTQDGQVKFKYTETTQTTVGGSAITVPEQFLLQLPVFIGGQPIQMQALLRYRIKDQKLVIFYTLVRPEEAKRVAFLGARDAIERTLGTTIINGKPA